jgi:hypothetical protein
MFYILCPNVEWKSSNRKPLFITPIQPLAFEIMDVPDDLPPVDNPPNDANPGRLQQVSTLADRRNVINWMIEDEVLHGFNGLYRHAINTFPANFRGQKTTNTMKATRWWQQQEEFTNNIADRSIIFSASQSRLSKRKRILTKARPGRGTKRFEWVLWLHPNLLAAFEHFKRAVVKFSAKLLCELALSVLLGLDSIFTKQSQDPKDNRLLTEKICYNWIQQFMDVHNIVLLSQRGRLMCSVEKELQIEMGTTYHLGVLQRGFQSGEFDENVMENLDELHFVVNLDNGHMLGFRGDTSITYAKVVSGGDSMTMVVRISRGRRSMIEAPMLIFTNVHRSYPIRELEDTIPGVTYKTGPKGWMDQSIFPEYFNEPQVFQADVQQRTKVVWLDNCSNHSLTLRLTTVLTGKNTILRYLPPCSTHLCQLGNIFIIMR